MVLPNDHYTYRVTWFAEDNEYVGLCAEYPGLSWLSSTPEDAFHGIRQVVANVVEDMRKSEEKIPEPFATRKFSGRFMIRIPPELHRRLVIEAAEAGISLNRLVSDKLSNA